MENFYFSCIYELLQGDATHAATQSQLNRLKAKLVCLQHRNLQKKLLDSDEADRVEGESPSLYTVLRMKRRREERSIPALHDDGGVLQTTPGEIARTMTTHLRNKYKPIPVERPSVRLLAVLHSPSTTDDMDNLTKPFDAAEIHEAFCAGKRRRAPGYDGIVRVVPQCMGSHTGGHVHDL
jgi:hypothetical protein